MTVNPAPEAKTAILSTWLKALLILRLVSLVTQLIGYLPLELAWLPWVDAALSALAILYLFQLGRANKRYRKSAVFSTVLFCYSLFNLVTSLFPAAYYKALSNYEYGPLTVGILLPLLSLLSILAVYQEYHAHADEIKVLDPKLSGNWHVLFNYTLAGSIMRSAISWTVVLLVVEGYLNTSTADISRFLAGGIDFVLQLFYLVYLEKTTQTICQ